MKIYCMFLSLACFGFCAFLTSCSSKAEATLPTLNQIQNISTPKDDCKEWNAIFEKLPEWARNELQKEGITIGGNGYLIGENLIKDCRLRIEIGGYIRKIIIGTDEESDRGFAVKNSAEIVRVIKHTWNYYSDGATSEKYNLLHKSSGLIDEDVAPLVSQLLDKEGLVSESGEPEIFCVLLSRPLPSLSSQILNSFQQSEKLEDFTGQVYALYLLHRDTSEQKYLAKMKAITKNPKLSNAAKTVLEEIITKIEQGQEVDFECLEDFGYAVINNKSFRK